ncbi:MAG: rhodanese-like domain-containing protein [Candidatus Thermoplasmatota archaeon]|jgi:rhodanese-related sulfurtransferase|nr:rhodanese-like domain-containing protein [Candidatus Thermoplasmatota archaeon]
MEYESLIEKIQSQEIVVLDTRNNHDFMKSHVPGSVSAPFSTYGWARSIKSWLSGTEIDLGLVAENDETATKAVEELKKVDIHVTEVISDSLAKWKQDGFQLSSVGEITPDDVYREFDRYTVIDVREPFEWQSGTIKNSLKIPMNELPSRLNELNKSDRYAIICAHGNRSEVAALFLADNGLNAATVAGGIQKWISEQLPVEFEE